MEKAKEELTGMAEKLLMLMEVENRKKIDELDSREKELERREALLESSLALTGEFVVFDVGGTCFKLAVATINDKHRGLDFFQALISKNWKTWSEDGKPIFLDRDPKVFEYVLEFCRYGQVSLITDPVMLKKLIIDADYYNLPRLKNRATRMFYNVRDVTHFLPSHFILEGARRWARSQERCRRLTLQFFFARGSRRVLELADRQRRS